MIYVECKPDELLVRVVSGLSSRIISHELKGKSGVVERLSTLRNVGGMVDEDPLSVMPRYLRTLEEVGDFPDVGLKLLNDRSRKNQLVVVRPRLEEWILLSSRDAGVEVESFGVPRLPNQLHRRFNEDLRPLERLLLALQDANSGRLRALGNLLGQLNR